MTDEKEYGTVIPLIFQSPGSNQFWRGNPADAPAEYDPVGWVKLGENRLYTDQSSLDVKSQIGKPEELVEPDTLSSSSSKPDIKRELMEFLRYWREKRHWLNLTIILHLKVMTIVGHMATSRSGAQPNSGRPMKLT
jgi:hypothetical protein